MYNWLCKQVCSIAMHCIETLTIITQNEITTGKMFHFYTEQGQPKKYNIQLEGCYKMQNLCSTD